MVLIKMHMANVDYFAHSATLVLEVTDCSHLFIAPRFALLVIILI